MGDLGSVVVSMKKRQQFPKSVRTSTHWKLDDLNSLALDYPNHF